MTKSKKREDSLKYDRETKDFHRQVILDHLSTHPCVHCSESDIRVLEFDHLGNKRENISAMVGKRTIGEILKEIDKCQVLCCNCHRRKTCADDDNYKQRYHIKNHGNRS